MILELKEYELLKGKGLCDIGAYSETGLFIVDDGISSHIVSVPDINQPPFVLPIPSGLIKAHIRKEASKEAERDLSAKMLERLRDISSKVDEILDLTENQPKGQNIGGVSEDALIKILSIQQKVNMK